MNKYLVAFWVIVAPAGLLIALNAGDFVHMLNETLGGGFTRQNVGITYLIICLVIGNLAFKKHKN